MIKLLLFLGSDIVRKSPEFDIFLFMLRDRDRQSQDGTRVCIKHVRVCSSYPRHYMELGRNIWICYAKCILFPVNTNLRQSEWLFSSTIWYQITIGQKRTLILLKADFQNLWNTLKNPQFKVTDCLFSLHWILLIRKGKAEIFYIKARNKKA